MAFTEPEIRSIFEILEVPYSTGYTVTDGMGAIGALTEISNNSTGQAKTYLLEYLAAMDATSIAKVQALVVQWDSVRLQIARVDDGSVGENAVTGVTYSAADKQQRIKELTQVYVPFFRFHEVLAKRAGNKNSLTIPSVW